MTTEPFEVEVEAGTWPPSNKSIVNMGSISDPKKRTGVGFMIYRVGTIYEGEWLRGNRHGLGVCFFHTGNIYIGRFEHGVMEGEGTMLFPTGGFFSGEFRQSSFYNGHTIFGREVRSVYKSGQEEALQPANQLPDQLQRAHAAVFSILMKNVKEHFGEYAASVGIVRAASPIIAASDAPSQQLGETPPILFSNRPITVINQREEVEIQNMSFTSTHIHAGSDGETEKVAEPPVLERNDFVSSRPTIFSGSIPVNNEYMSLSRFLKRLAVFLFPFLSLPWGPFAPLRITSLEVEREFVVSGATLRRDFDPPSYSMCVIAVGVCCQVASIVIVACKVTIGTAQEGRLTLPEMVIPCVLWLLTGLCGAAYNSYRRVPHCLERMNRTLTPELSAFAADVVDAQASVCIYTWDEQGRCKVMNPHYRYRWTCLSIVFGAMMSLSAPATRGGFGHGMYGKKGFEMAASLLAFFATFMFSSLITYSVVKMTDMQRDVNAKMVVLSNLAVMDQRSVGNPSMQFKRSFSVDDQVNTADLFHGFSGWYVTRSMSMYASTSSNHSARSMCVSFFILGMFFAFVVALADVSYMVRHDYTRSTSYYSTAHSYAIFAFVFWGFLLGRYLYVCACTAQEEANHLYIMDLAAQHHLISRSDVVSHDIVTSCRKAAANNDVYPTIFDSPIYPLLIAILICLNAVGLAAIGYQLGVVICY